MRLIFTLFLLFTIGIGQSTLAQENFIEGFLLDEQTKKPIPFASIQLLGSTSTKGTVSDVRGWFRLYPSQRDTAVLISHVSYEKTNLTLDRLAIEKDILIRPSTVVLGEFVFEAEENPALAIIRKAINEKPNNDPEKLESYRYTAYHKTVLTFDGLTEFPEYDDEDLGVLEGGHIFMAESLSQVKYRRPGKLNEVVKASKISGIDNPIVALAASTFQPFSFYANHFNVLETPYLNPLSKDGLNKYDYYLEDSVLREYGNTYIIAYQPKKKKNFQLLKGWLYISEQGYALENMTLSPADSSLSFDFEMQQKNRWDGTHWFPEQLNSSFRTKTNDFEDRNLLIKNQTFLSQIEINQLDRKERFEPTTLRMDIRKQPVDWSAVRLDSLTYREYATYVRFDNMPDKDKRRLNSLSKILGSALSGRFPIGPVDIIPERILRLNRYEGFAPGLGLASNNSLSSFFRIDGYFRYGFRDRAFKYGGGMDLFLEKKYDSRIRLDYSRDLIETGASQLPRLRTFALGGDSFRRFAAERMDSLQRFAVSFSQMPVKGVRVEAFALHDIRSTVMGFAENPISENYPTAFKASEVGLNFRWTGKESMGRIGNELLSITTSYPVLAFRVSKALPDVLGGDVDFTHAELRFFHQWSKGNSMNRFSLQAQKLWGDQLPISYIHTGYGINIFRRNAWDFAFLFPSYLQTMSVYEFYSDQSLLLSYSHQTGPIFDTNFGRINFAPQVRLIQQFSIGSLSNPEFYSFVDFKTMERGYWESGLEFNNLFRMAAGLQRRSFGIGAFYRYGPYANPIWQDNVVITVSMNVAF